MPCGREIRLRRVKSLRRWGIYFISLDAKRQISQFAEQIISPWAKRAILLSVWIKRFEYWARSVSRGAGLQWRPLHEVQKHRPSRQARPSPSAPAIDIKPFRSIWLYFFCSFSNTFSNTFNFLWLIDTAWIFSICTKNRWYIKDLQVIKQIIITQCKEYSMQLQNRVPGFVAERCRWQMQRGEDGAAVKIWRNTAIFWAPQEGLRSNFKSVCIS